MRDNADELAARRQLGLAALNAWMGYGVVPKSPRYDCRDYPQALLALVINPAAGTGRHHSPDPDPYLRPGPNVIVTLALVSIDTVALTLSCTPSLNHTTSCTSPCLQCVW